MSSFHWGTGSGLAGIEMEENNLRDAVCDIAARRCVGVNGVNLTGWKMEGARLDPQMDSPYDWNRKLVVVFYGTDANHEYRLSVNGGDRGRFTGKQLRSGVNVAVLER